MIRPTLFMSMLLPLLGHRAVAERMQGGRMQGGRRSGVDIHHHPGHPPFHVTRLHRYEHMGMQSMIEQEEQWHQDMRLKRERSASRRMLKEVRHVRGTSLLQGSTEKNTVAEKHSDWVKLSDIQAQALEEHHQAWQNQEALGDDLGHVPVAVTALSSLNSQYVGPIGVGSVVPSAGCASAKSANSVNNTGISLEQVSSCSTAQSKVWVVYDTGSTNIWVNSDMCTEGACVLPGRHRYNHTASASFAFPDSMLQLSVQFATGKITGPQGRDDFHIGPFTVHNQTFGLIQTEEGRVFTDVKFDGIVGMAFDAMSANNVAPFFSSIIEQKALKHNEFAFYFSKEDPAANGLFWGGVDKSFYDGELQYFPVIDPYYWSLKLLNFKVGDKGILDSSNTYDAKRYNNSARRWDGPVAIVDTGTTFFTLEGDKFDHVMKMIPPTDCDSITTESHPPITISIENTRGEPHDFVLSNKQYMSKSETMCSPSFMKVALPPAHGPGCILGEVFLRNFFSVFDRVTGKDTDAKVAFAASSDKPEARSRLHELTLDQPKFNQEKAAETMKPLS